MSISSNQTCNVNFYPDWKSLDGIPTKVDIGGLSRRNDTLIAMQKCCSPNPVHSAGDDNCSLWCEIPKDMTQEEWAHCTSRYVPESHIVAYRNEGMIATAMRPTLMRLAVTALLVSGLCAL
ncbi:hypothetical protein F4678DRAFT_363420 [Xylaria arbuscula]|nr:hypothetical protein F4678DRAFT_363420 [Xylaria arbuscula]